MRPKPNYEGGVTLGELIAALEAAPFKDSPRPYGIGRAMSYRGYYECVGFEPECNATPEAMLVHAKAALGATYTGYKGGEHTMKADTECYVASYGNTGNALTPELLKIILGEP
jgi:hypothetical protein